MGICLEVWGDYALFTRPEMKAERVSYDMMTPSAARGLVNLFSGILDYLGSSTASTSASPCSLPISAATKSRPRSPPELPKR